MGIQYHGFETGDFCFFKDFSIDDEVTFVDVKNGAEAALVEPFEEL